MSRPSRGDRVLQDNQDTLPRSPAIATPPVTPPVAEGGGGGWERGARGLSSAPWREVREWRAEEEEGGGAGGESDTPWGRSGPWRDRTHARRDLR